MEAKWYHFGSIFHGFWVQVGRILDASSKARWRNARARALDIPNDEVDNTRSCSQALSITKKLSEIKPHAIGTTENVLAASRNQERTCKAFNNVSRAILKQA